MRSWKESLFLQGTGEVDFTTWESSLRQREITTVVCLIPTDELSRISPDFLAWMEAQSAPSELSPEPPSEQDLEPEQGPELSVPVPSAPELGSWPGPYIDIIHLPLPEGGTPDEHRWHRFWQLAEKVANRVAEGLRVVVLCRSGIDRTGLFAVAVLRKIGLSLETALRMMTDAGSQPETVEQFAFLATTGCDCSFGELGITEGTALDGPQGVQVIAVSGGTSQLVRLETPEHSCVGTLRDVTRRSLAQDLTIPAELLRLWKLDGETLLARCLGQKKHRLEAV